MAEIPSQLNDLSKQSVETALAFARITMDNAERMVRLQLDAAKALVEESASQAKALAGASDPAQLADLRARAAEATMQKAVDFSKQVYDAAAQAQNEMAKLVESRMTQFNQSMVAAMEQAFKSAPGADPALAAFRSALDAGSGAASSMTRMAQQMSATAAQAAFKQARDVATKASGRKK